MGKAHPHIEDNLLYSKCTDLMLIVSENIVIETAKLVLTKQLCTMAQPSSHIKLTITDSIESSHISHSQFPLFSTSYIITLLHYHNDTWLTQFHSFFRFPHFFILMSFLCLSIPSRLSHYHVPLVSSWLVSLFLMTLTALRNFGQIFCSIM